MRIHTIINNKQWVQECDNVLFEIQGIKKPLPETNRTNYNLVTLVMQARIALKTELSRPSYYCHDCSYDRGKPVYHKDTNDFLEFREKHKRYAKQLQEIHDILY